MWKLYTETKSNIEGLTSAEKIISTIGEDFLPFFCSTKSTETRKKTTKLFEVLTELGDSLNYKVYSHGLSKEFLEKHNHKFKNREWLYDLHWYTEKKDKGCMPLTLPLIVECEWRKRKSDDKDEKEKHGEIKYDFQKLLISNSDLRLMLFTVKNEDEANKLYKYFREAIDTYTPLQAESKFLFVGFCFEKKGFYYTKLVKQCNKRTS
jgi:hypothetical protein